jgi:hypothetical protein
MAAGYPGPVTGWWFPDVRPLGQRAGGDLLRPGSDPPDVPVAGHVVADPAPQLPLAHVGCEPLPG